MEIEQLLEQYFEGLTTSAEEATLRRFFTSDDVPENLRMYKPLFACFEQEIRNRSRATPNARKTFMLWISGAAACAAILAGSFFFTSQRNNCPVSGDYVIIDGRCYTDAATIRSTTLKTLLEISEDGAFLSDEQPSNVLKIIENQLKEFDFLLDE